MDDPITGRGDSRRVHDDWCAVWNDLTRVTADVRAVYIDQLGEVIDHLADVIDHLPHSSARERASPFRDARASFVDFCTVALDRA
jgi:hypothetical protein